MEIFPLFKLRLFFTHYIYVFTFPKINTLNIILLTQCTSFSAFRDNSNGWRVFDVASVSRSLLGKVIEQRPSPIVHTMHALKKGCLTHIHDALYQVRGHIIIGPQSPFFFLLTND